MAPLWKSMLSKSSPLYRDSLYSFSLWDCRVQERELLLLKKHSDRERRGLLRQLDTLSKELQQKDKVIESLRARLAPPRSDTPSTDQSDRISFVSDDQGSANEDLELGSEMDAASEYGQAERGASTRGSTGYSLPQSKPLQGFPTPPHPHPDPSRGFLPLSLSSYSSFDPSRLAGPAPGLPASHSAASLLESSALWDMTYGAQPMRVGAADVSSGSSGYQSGTSHAGSELMKEHLVEIRSLRQRLEDSIQTNDRLRRQLEDRLASAARDTGAPTNIYIQGLDSVSQLSHEIRALKDQNVNLQGQLKQASRDGTEELREAVLLGRARLKEAELEKEKWAEQSRRLQTHTQAQEQQVAQLKQERQSHQETINRLQHEVTVLQQQVCESRGLVQSLQSELHMYHRVCGVPDDTHALLGDTPKTTFDPRDLEQRLTGGRGQGETRPPHARRQLFHDNVPSPPVRDTGLCGPFSPLSPILEPDEPQPPDHDSRLEGQSPDGSFAHRDGRHVVGHVDDFNALRQQILEGGLLVRKMETALQASPTLHASPDVPGSVRSLLTSTRTLRQVLEEAGSLLQMFWRAALPRSDGSHHSTKEQSLVEEMSMLRHRLSQQEEALRDAMERLRSSNRTKDSMELFIVSQLSRTRDVLTKAKTNLQARTQEPSVSSPVLLVGVS